MRKTSLAALTALLSGALLLPLGLVGPACAGPIGLRPLGGDFESARTVGPGNWAVEGGGWYPMFSPLDASATADDQAVLDNWGQLPAWPMFHGQYGLSENNEVVVSVGPQTTAGYRKFFLRADAPWGGEYLQALLQAGAGVQVAARKPMAYLRVPAIYERGDFTFHVAGGGYYLFNDQPIIDGNFGMEWRPIPQIHIGGNARLRMDAKKVTPMDGTWTLGGGIRYQPLSWACAQVEVLQDAGPPVPVDTNSAGISIARPHIELPLQALRASVTVYF